MARLRQHEILLGLAGAILGIAPSYVGGQFPTAIRGTASGLVYHAAGVIGAAAPYALGALHDAGWPLRRSDGRCVWVVPVWSFWRMCGATVVDS